MSERVSHEDLSGLPYHRPEGIGRRAFDKRPGVELTYGQVHKWNTRENHGKKKPSPGGTFILRPDRHSGVGYESRRNMDPKKPSPVRRGERLRGVEHWREGVLDAIDVVVDFKGASPMRMRQRRFRPV